MINSVYTKHHEHTQLYPLISHIELLLLSLQNSFCKLCKIMDVNCSFLLFLGIQIKLVYKALDTLGNVQFMLLVGS